MVFLLSFCGLFVVFFYVVRMPEIFGQGQAHAVGGKLLRRTLALAPGTENRDVGISDAMGIPESVFILGNGVFRHGFSSLLRRPANRTRRGSSPRPVCNMFPRAVRFMQR